MTNEYISRHRLIDVLNSTSTKAFAKDELVDILENFPAADVTEVEIVPWRCTFDGVVARWMECSKCGNSFTERKEKPFDICPFCGSRRLNDDD